MVRTQIQLHPKQLQWLKHQAAKDGISMSQMIRDCIDLYRAHSEQSSRLKGIRTKALAAMGSFSTGTGRD
jgi:hypothetical protein